MAKKTSLTKMQEHAANVWMLEHKDTVKSKLSSETAEVMSRELKFHVTPLYVTRRGQGLGILAPGQRPKSSRITELERVVKSFDERLTRCEAALRLRQVG